MIEVKFSPAACEISGYASVWHGAPDAVGDLVSPGAFTTSIARALPEMKREHAGPAIGRWTSAEEDSTGLKLSGVVTDPQTIADLRQGRIDGLSIGFVEKKSSTNAAGNRVLQVVDLHEVSLVKRPAKNSTRVLSIKSFKSCSTRKVSKMATTNETTACADNCDPAEDAATDDRISALESGLADHEKRLSSIEAGVNKSVKSLDAIQTMLRRPGAASVPASVETKSAEIETKAFSAYLRHGRETMEVAEVKSMRIADSSQGGYLAPVELYNQIEKNLVLNSPIRSIAKVANTGAFSVVLPARTSAPTMHWVGETETRTAAQSAYGQLEFPIWEMAGFVDVSQQLLEDSQFPIETEIATDIAAELARLEGNSFVTGTGVKQPLGFLNAGLTSVNSGSASTLTAPGIISLFHALPAQYRNVGTWVMSSDTLGVVRGLKDPATGTYLLMTSGLGNAPVSTILGRPVIEASSADMPAVGAGNYPICFGDWSAFRIFDRVGLSILRDNLTQATNGLVRFHIRKRLGAGVARTEALKLQKVSA